MPYINFKEENYKLLNQMQKRKGNNAYIREKIIKDCSLVKKYIPFDKYCFKDIKNKLIGRESTLAEDDFLEVVGKNIICANFYNCKFKNIKFKDCSFIGCSFKKCDFEGGGVVFENCVFAKNDSIKIPSLNIEDNFSSSFELCSIYAKFKGCNLSYCTFEHSILKNTNFELCDMKSVVIFICNLYNIKVGDCDFQGFKTYKCYIEDFEFEDKYMTTFDEKTFFDKLVRKNHDRDEYEGFYTIYQNIANKYKQNNLNSNFGEYYYLAKKEEHKVLDFFPKLSSYLYYISCGYGERPLYSVYFSLFIMVLFAFLFLFFGLKIGNEVVRYSIYSIQFMSFERFYRDFMEALTLSIGMFAGIGVENSVPIISSYMISNIEMLIGIVMIGVGVGTLTRKIIR